MKKIYLLLVFVATLVMTSCDKQEYDKPMLSEDMFYQSDWVGTVAGEFARKMYTIEIGLRFGTDDGYCVAMDGQELPSGYDKWAGITYTFVDNVLTIKDGSDYTNIFGIWFFEKKKGDDYIFTKDKYTEYFATLTIRRDK